MGIGRTILALLISLSVAILPAAGGAAFKLKSSGTAEMSTTEPAHDCCPADFDPCAKTMDDCTSMAACALKCFSFSDGTWSPLVYPSRLAGTMPLLRSAPLSSQLGSPPFRPPRA